MYRIQPSTSRAWAPLLTAILFLSATAAGDAPTAPTAAGHRQGEPAPPPAPGLGAPLAEVAFDEPGDGTLWARGRHWKMGFDGRGAVYHAGFSVDLPSLLLELSPGTVTLAGAPLAFGAPSAIRRGAGRVELERGAFVETYELGLDAVEQLFVFEKLPRRGELVVRIPLPQVDSADASEEGLVLHTEIGSVRYSRAVAIDARGARVVAPTSFEDGEIVIRVDAAFVARAALPLTIDPFVTHTWLDLTTMDCREPDVVYDSGNNLWIAVFQEAFSATDHDVRVQAIDSMGFITHNGYIDSSGEKWSKPRIAYLRVDTRCMVVCEVGLNGSRIVRGRTIRPNGTIWEYGSPLTISSAQSGEKLAPTVGGDPYSSQPSYFCIAFQRELLQQTPEFEIQYALVNSVSQLSYGPVAIPSAGSVRDIQPSLSRSNGTHRWTLAFQRVDAVTFGDIYACYIDANGVLSPTFGVTAFGLARDFAPSASSPLLDTSRSAIAFQRRSGFVGQTDVMVALIEDGAVLDLVNLSVLEGAGTQGLDQAEPSIDSDGRHFMVAYAEAFASNPANYAVWVSDLFVSGTKLGVAQAHQEILAFGLLQRAPRVAASRTQPNGPNDFTIAAHLRFSDTDYDVFATRWRSVRGGSWSTYCHGDGSGGACPCGNYGSVGHGCSNSVLASGARLEVYAGEAAMQADSLVLIALDLPPDQFCLFFQGTAELAGSPFGDGLLCVGGGIVRYTVKPTTFSLASYPELGDPALSVAGLVPSEGGLRTYQVWYRDPSNFCTSTGFNLTNAVRVHWAY